MGQGAERRNRPGRHAAEIRLDAEHAAEAGRNADRAAAIGAQRQRRSRAASAADEPPDEPPGVLSRFQGLRVMPVKGESVTPFQP